MKKILSEIRGRLYLAARTNGLIADFGYWSAHYIQNFLRNRQYKKLRQLARQELAEDNVLKHRHLVPTPCWRRE
jgi:hypothetical protein